MTCPICNKGRIDYIEHGGFTNIYLIDGNGALYSENKWANAEQCTYICRNCEKTYSYEDILKMTGK